MSLNPRVLLVDDDPDISLALSDYLRKEGFDVEVVETGNSAIQKGTTDSYDVVLLDVGLPDRDGIDVMEELSNQKPNLPIVLLTAFTSLRKTTSPEKLNKAFAYLTKPYSREEVKEVLYRSVLRHRQETKERTTKASALPSSAEPILRFPSILQPSEPGKMEGTDQDQSFTVEDYQRLVEDVKLMEYTFDQISEAILVADANKLFRFVNQAAAQELGYTKEELENLSIPDIAPNHDNQRYQEHLQDLREGKTLTYYTTHRTKQGQEIPITISVYLFNFQEKEFTCAITKPSKVRVEPTQELKESPPSNA